MCIIFHEGPIILESAVKKCVHILFIMNKYTQLA